MHRRSKTGNADDERIDFFFYCDPFNGTPINNEPNKCSELIWVDIDDIKAEVIDYVGEAIGNGLNGIPLSEKGW